MAFSIFLCDFPSQPELTADAIAAKAIRMYRMRWKIEEAHRYIKQEYGWEKMQLTSYTRLKNMNQLLLIAMCYLYSLKKFVNVLLEAFPSIMKNSNKRWKKVYDFVYYKLSALLQSCFMHIKRYDLCPYAGKWHDQNQLQIPFMKNGGM